MAIPEFVSRCRPQRVRSESLRVLVTPDTSIAEHGSYHCGNLADAVDAFTVFNIGGNKYRLISVIRYRWQIAYIRQILTHAEYDKGRWKL